MNKSDLISAMAAEAQMSKADAKKALDAFITSVTNAMKAGDKVSLVGFGTFSVSESRFHSFPFHSIRSHSM